MDMLAGTLTGIVIFTSGLLPELQKEFKNENTCVNRCVCIMEICFCILD